MQVTAIAALEVDSDPLMLHRIADNIRAGTKYLQFCLDRQGSILGALAQYNGGYRAASALREGEALPEESAQYVLKVLTAMGRY